MTPTAFLPSRSAASRAHPSCLQAIAARGGDYPDLEPMFEAAVRDTIERFEATGSPVITDGAQRKYHNFWTYAVQGLPNSPPDGFRIPFASGHTRPMPRLTCVLGTRMAAERLGVS